MPNDAILVSIAVVAVFVVFAAVLLWADLQTRPDQIKAAAIPQKLQHA